jgi:serine/threonine protein kinase
MPPERPTPTLLEGLRDSGLLTDAQLDELQGCPEASDPAPAPLARVVLRRGWLTRFQLNAIAAGRGKELAVGPYVLLDRLGEGGMGTVYKARHRYMQRVVALKIIRKEKLGSPEAVKRFDQEVRLAATLSHPNVVVAFDSGQAVNTYFLAMEYVEGVDLARLVRENGPLPAARACDYVRQAALGLQHAHEKGLVHRDIKPSNLMLSQAQGLQPLGLVKILDMGLARLRRGGDSAMTRTGAVIGTPDYLAPEQALDSRAADVRADLYSLGGTLLYLLSGRPPFAAAELTEVLLKHQTEQPETLARRGVEAPAEVQDVLDRLLAKRPEDRYQTPAELAEALAPFCGAAAGGAGLPSPAARRPVDNEWESLDLGDTEDDARPARRERARELSRGSAAGRRDKRVWIIGAAAATVLVGVAVVGAAWHLANSPKPAQLAQGPAAGTGVGKPREPAGPAQDSARRPKGPGAAPTAVADERPAPPAGKKRVAYVDLGPKANHPLDETFPAVTLALEGNDLADLKPGEHTLEGLDFNVGAGTVQLANRKLRESLPEKVEGVKVAAKFASLHILHATGNAVPDGTPIARYVVRYADRGEEMIEVVYGQDVRDWWCRNGEPATTRGKVVWTGSNGAARSFQTSIRLFATTWANPRPGAEVAAIDYVSTMTDAAPFLVAMSLEDVQ